MVGAPVAFQTFDPRQQPSQFLLSGAVGTGVVVLLAVLRIYLGWAVRPGFPALQRVPHRCCTCTDTSSSVLSIATVLCMLLWGWSAFLSGVCLSSLRTLLVYASVGLGWLP